MVIMIVRETKSLTRSFGVIGVNLILFSNLSLSPFFYISLIFRSIRWSKMSWTQNVVNTSVAM